MPPKPERSTNSVISTINAIASSALLILAVHIEHRLTDLEVKIGFIMTAVRVHIKTP